MPKVTGPLLDLYDPEASCKKNDEDIGKGSGGDEIDIDNFLVDQEEGDGEGSGRYGTIPPFPPPPPGLNGYAPILRGEKGERGPRARLFIYFSIMKDQFLISLSILLHYL
ncbi:unnamed protein product [Leptidea sinapis]|uniref:Uncharacterized protein n=1 Tax=Leptidea sinapis TaxID=189913 RepID=A0A5E4QY03_9NEOP|nr:unnamed protein product [Leptidea sinapis]